MAQTGSANKKIWFMEALEFFTFFFYYMLFDMVKCCKVRKLQEILWHSSCLSELFLHSTFNISFCFFLYKHYLKTEQFVTVFVEPPFWNDDEFSSRDLIATTSYRFLAISFSCKKTKQKNNRSKNQKSEIKKINMEKLKSFWTSWNDLPQWERT